MPPMNPDDPSAGITHRAVGAVKAAPLIRIGHFVHRGCSLAGLVQGFRIFYLVAEGAGLIRVGIHDKGELSASLIPDRVNILQFRVVAEHSHRVIYGFVSGRILVPGPQGFQNIPVHRSGGAVGDIHHALLDRLADADPGP